MSTEYKDEIEVWLDDYGYEIHLQCTDNDDPPNPFDLTGYTCKVRVSLPDAIASKFQADGNIDDAENGKLHFIVADGNFNEAGKTYVVSVVATKASVQVTFGGLQIKVGWTPRATSS